MSQTPTDDAPRRTMRFRMGLLEWLVVISLMGIGLALFGPKASDESRLGQFTIRLSLPPVSQAECPMRAVVEKEDMLAAMFKRNAGEALKWKAIDAGAVVQELRGSYRKKTEPGYLWNVQTQLPHDDAVLVEYTLPDGERRLRMIRFSRAAGQDVVEITVPRDPPNAAEAWRAEPLSSEPGASATGDQE